MLNCGLANTRPWIVVCPPSSDSPIPLLIGCSSCSRFRVGEAGVPHRSANGQPAREGGRGLVPGAPCEREGRDCPNRKRRSLSLVCVVHGAWTGSDTETIALSVDTGLDEMTRRWSDCCKRLKTSVWVQRAVSGSLIAYSRGKRLLCVPCLTSDYLLAVCSNPAGRVTT